MNTKQVVIKRPTSFEETIKTFKLSKKRVKQIKKWVDEILGKCGVSG